MAAGFNLVTAAPYIQEAAAYQGMPEAVLYRVLSKEGCHPGFQKRNRDGSTDFGIGCVNSSWEKYFAQQNISMSTIRDDSRTGVHAAAHILRKHYNRYGDWYKAVMAYHTGSVGKYGSKIYSRGWTYAYDVFTRSIVNPSPGKSEASSGRKSSFG